MAKAIREFGKKIPEIPSGIIFPHVSFRGQRDYPNQALEAIQLILFDVAVNQSEIFLQRNFRNPIEIIDATGKVIDIVYTESIDESLGEFKSSTKMVPFLEAYGKKFSFVNNKGQKIELEKEEDTYLGQVMRKKGKTQWKQIVVSLEEESPDLPELVVEN